MPVSSALATAFEALLPQDVSLDRFNSEYLQKHADSPPSVLAAAQALRLLGNPAQEVEDLLFGQLRPDSKLDFKVRAVLPCFFV